MRLLLMVLLSALVLAGCGESDEDKAKSAAVGFYSALGTGQTQKACGFLTETAANKLTFTSDKKTTCTKELAGITGPAIPKDPRADSVDIHGSEAVVEVSGKRGAGARIRLEKVGGTWKVSDF